MIKTASYEFYAAENGGLTEIELHEIALKEAYEAGYKCRMNTQNPYKFKSDLYIEFKNGVYDGLREYAD